ncbi:phage filamentation protein Fil family protein [Pantoea sp. AS-PWVM4]|uniref:phage filamentation protein Fil family protein n=1 Tax=Pantoea sp. AS-PWVM4 TaxID=1332069 RepID=UPI0008FEDA15|nr:phage filamentation protein Fil family protein [Pantoea sp. AS-PWVM4]
MPVFVTLLKNQSPHQQLKTFGHGWIETVNGRRWHPAHSQAELLAGLTRNRKKSWITKLKTLLFR